MATEVISVLREEKYLMEVSAGKNTIIADEPISKGGQEKGFNPFELLASALSTCTSATIKMFAERREWNLEEVSVKVNFEGVKEGITFIQKEIFLKGNLTQEQKDALLKVAHACPVQKVLESEILIESAIGN
ncbi:MAG: OsmC family protein [Bergeyella zoohelcum]|nr:OsmC family protein [Bergeyella zoohelcum]